MIDSLSKCPEALGHGPADGAGRCPWCRRKITYPRARQSRFGTSWRELDTLAAYRRFYDPDWGTDNADSDPTR